LAYAGFAVAGVAAYLGGSLVYGTKIGVDHSTPSAPPDDGWHDAGEEANLSEGKPVRVDVSGSRVLLLKQGTELFCMSEVCSHLGGPLAEGEIHDETVTCPWHGSRFSLRDGSVIDGPATHAQACWEARIQQGRVQVKARSQG
jgi:nitrite reductase/ring-hydroxylating ferredoxin subunit